MAKITIGMPVFNDVNFIEASIKSLLNQTFQDFILIISDDGSTDGSGEICKRYASQDNRITYIRQPNNLGISRNMEFLLAKAETPYFMWAADDDLWDNDFIKILISLLEQNPMAVSAFTIFAHIDEKGEQISNDFNYNYKNIKFINRIKFFIKNPNDTFGYGIFRTEKIKGVKFPVWWWPNQKCAYNNIYPTLCYYLAQGDYAHYNEKSLFFNRIKPKGKVNHKLPFRKDGIRETLAYALRKFNLIWVSASMIRKSSGTLNTVKIFPHLMIHWFFKPSHLKIKHYFKSKIAPHKIPGYLD